MTKRALHIAATTAGNRKITLTHPSTSFMTVIAVCVS